MRPMLTEFGTRRSERMDVRENSVRNCACLVAPHPIRTRTSSEPIFMYDPLGVSPTATKSGFHQPKWIGTRTRFTSAPSTTRQACTTRNLAAALRGGCCINPRRAISIRSNLLRVGFQIGDPKGRTRVTGRHVVERRRRRGYSSSRRPAFSKRLCATATAGRNRPTGRGGRYSFPRKQKRDGRCPLCTEAALRPRR